jgi:hypothetical protein
MLFEYLSKELLAVDETNATDFLSINHFAF